MAFSQKSICLFLGCLFLLSFNLAGQNILDGDVANAETGKGLTGANVFLNNTTIGTESKKDGRFTLADIPDGSYTLVVSFVGFSTFTKKVKFPTWDGQNLSISLKPKTSKLTEAVVEASRSKRWKRNYSKFKDYFLGHTQNAEKTTILNPQALRFKQSGDTFITTTTGPLVIRNMALGYYIRLYLDKFTRTGQTSTSSMHAKFVPIKSKKDKQTEKWREARQRAYKGSFKHFIDALINGSLKDDGYILSYANNATYGPDHIDRYTQTNLTNPSKLFRLTKPNRITFKFDRDYPYIQVDYLNEYPEARIARRAHYEKHYHQVSFISLPNGKAIIDTRSSSQIYPYKVNLSGYWGWTSFIPDQLPKNYDPSDN